MDDTRTDERVEIAAAALYGSMFNDPPDGFPSEGVATVQRHRARNVIAGLEASGYTVARLEQVGRGEPYDWSLGEHGDPTRQPWILSSHRTSDNAWPVYRIIDAPAVEEAD